MDFNKLCEPFYNKEDKSLNGLSGVTSKNKIAEFFIREALGESKDEELVNYSDDYFRKWFNGERQVPLWGTIAEKCKESELCEKLAKKININALPRMLNDYGVKLKSDQTSDGEAFAYAITKQFLLIAQGNGFAEDVVGNEYNRIVNSDDFQKYIDASENKHKKLKTLLYSNEERLFESFYVCNNIVSCKDVGSQDKIVIKDVSLDKLRKITRCGIISGMGGVGKSMMIRHLFLESVHDRKKKETSLVPVIVVLREYGLESDDLFDLIYKTIHRFDLTIEEGQVVRALLQGRLQILLDGLDEVNPKMLNNLLHQIDCFSDQYEDVQIVISTRRFMDFVGLSKFNLFTMEGFSIDQAIELIDKLECDAEEVETKKRFKEKLENELYNTHKEFAENPLLLTLMYINFRIFTDIPQKKNQFYKQAYETLLQKHDGNKLTLKRNFKSVKDTSDFTTVFSEFCARSYRKHVYQFDDYTFETYFDKLHTKDRFESSMMNVGNFKFDALNSSCVMFEEGGNYHFLHRSFQEYFFAEYYSRQDDETIVKVGKNLWNNDSNEFDESEGFNQLYECAPDKVERFIFLPFLRDIYEKKDDELSFWQFLRNCYRVLKYPFFYEEPLNQMQAIPILSTARMNKFCPSSNIVFDKIAELVWVRSGVEMYQELLIEGFEEDIDEYLLATTDHRLLMVPRQIYLSYQNNKILTSEMLFGDVERDEEGKVIVVGKMYKIEIQKMIDQPDKYQEVRSIMVNPRLNFRNIYDRLKQYYNKLKSKYEYVDYDDDDF